MSVEPLPVEVEADACAEDRSLPRGLTLETTMWVEAKSPVGTGPNTGLVNIRFSMARLLLRCDAPGLLKVLLSEVAARGPRRIELDTAEPGENTPLLIEIEVCS